MRIVTCNDVLHARRLIQNAHERCVHIEASQAQNWAVSCAAGEFRLHGHVNATCKVPMRNTKAMSTSWPQRHAHIAASPDVAVRERVVSVQIAVPQRMVVPSTLLRPEPVLPVILQRRVAPLAN